jgi:hypothetical protein
MKRQPRHKLASSLILNYLSTFLKKLSHGYDKILMSTSVKISLMVKYIEDNCQSLRSREKRISRQLICLYQWGMEIYDRATFLYYRLHRTLLFLFNFVLNNFN